MASVPTVYSYRRSFTVHLRERGSTLFVKTGPLGSIYRTRTGGAEGIARTNGRWGGKLPIGNATV